MALPAHALAGDDAMGIAYGVGSLLDEYAKSRSGVDFDPDAWEAVLEPLELHYAVLIHFMGGWENSGSFAYAAECWRDMAERVKGALVVFGCERAAELFDAAAAISVEIGDTYAADIDITPEQGDRRVQLNREADADVPYAKLAAFLRAHAGEFLKS